MEHVPKFDIDWTDINKKTMENLKRVIHSDEWVDLPSTEKARITMLVESALEVRTKEMDLTLKKRNWQIKVLRGTVLAEALLIMGLWWRVAYVEDIAMARAWKFMMEKGKAAAFVGARAGTLVLKQLEGMEQDVLNDPQADTETKRMRLEIIDSIVKRAYEAKIDFEANGKKFEKASADTPAKMTPLTIVKDPFTGVSVPLNSPSGEVDNKLLEHYFKEDKLMMGMLAVAKAATTETKRRADGGVGRVDPSVIAALGIKLPASTPNAEAEEARKEAEFHNNLLIQKIDAERQIIGRELDKKGRAEQWKQTPAIPESPQGNEGQR